MALVDGYFDESGKFKDHDVVSFAGVIGTQEQIASFTDDWERLLHKNGIACLTMKEAFNYNLPFGSKVPAQGLTDRISALTPFVECAKNHFGMIAGCAIDVKAFGSSPEVQKQLGKNPHYAAFGRTIITLMGALGEKHEANIICDDEEGTALGVYKLYRKIKLCYPLARKKLVSLSLADDEFFTPLQAADMCAAIIRRQAGLQFSAHENPYSPLFEKLVQDRGGPEAGVEVGLFDDKQISDLSNSYRDFEAANGKYGVPPLVEEQVKNPVSRKG